MTLRARLFWAFSTMLLVPMALLVLLSGVAQAFWMPADDLAAVGVLNQQLLDNPEALLTEQGFSRVTQALPAFVILGLEVDKTWRQVSPGFITQGPRERQRTLLNWTFRLGDGRLARLELRFSPHQFTTAANGRYLLFPLASLLILLLTNGTLTWVVSRSILRPLGQLEAAARKLGEGDLESSPLPGKPPEFRRVGNAFDDMRVRLKASLQERERLEEERRVWVAAVSHDLRTPLAVVRGYAEALRDGVPRTAEKREHYVAVLLERALQMERLVDDLFQWARWDWGQPQLQNQTLDLAEHVTQAVTRWAADWPTLRVEWVPPAQPVNVCADPMALRRIFDNLARNAVQHAGPDPALHLALEVAPLLHLHFRDQGPGIDPELLDKVFERFFRGDPARNPTWGGGGLGLTISRTLAEAHGGTLSARNASTGGAVFTLTLPIPASC